MSTFLTKLRLAANPDTFSGLAPQDFEERAGGMATDALERELRRSLGILAELGTGNEKAHADHNARVQRQAQAAFDEGRRYEADTDLYKSPELTAYVKAWCARAAELGLPSARLAFSGSPAEPGPADVRDHYSELVRVINGELRQRYARDGEPKAVTELRARILESKKAEWPVRRAYEDARKMVKELGLKAAEPEVQRAHAEFVKATSRTAALERELGTYPVSA